MDYHTIALQTYRLQQASVSADVRAAMIRGDHRDWIVIMNAETDRRDSAKLKPRERVLMDLADLREFDRYWFPKWSASCS